MKNLLIAVAGNTPQIITESLYYYTQVEKIPIAEIHVITTAKGRQTVERELINSGKGAYFRFCRDYHISCTEMRFHPIQVICDEEGEPVSDIRTIDQNTAAANLICRFVREKCEQENIRLFCSLAGGRKTMSAYMALAMQYFARPHDRLSHVLIQPEELENSPDFYYPPPDQTHITVRCRDGSKRQIPIDQIQIELADIQFVRLRSKLSYLFPTRTVTWQEMIFLSQDAIDRLIEPPCLTFHVKKRKIEIQQGNQNYLIRLPQKMAAVYHYLLQESPPGRLLDAQKEIRELYTRYYKIGIDLPADRFDQQDLLQQVAKINRHLTREIQNPGTLHFCKITNPKVEGLTHHKILLTEHRDRITILN